MSEPDKKQAMLETNKAQAEYYNETDGGLTSEVNGFATNLWRRMRLRTLGTVSSAAREGVYHIHRQWLGDLSHKKVLELGVGHGSPLSRYLASRSAAYHALDLSAREINLLRRKLPDKPTIHYHIGDFLSDDFAEGGFDVIYAHAVIHHFAHTDVLFDQLKAKLAPGGEVITYDPLQVWLPIRALRAAYRPFQTDADWEFPFTRQTCRDIAAAFDVKDRFGVFNRAKWALLLGIVNPALGKRKGDAWFRADLASRDSGRDTMQSLHISYRLARPADTHPA